MAPNPSHYRKKNGRGQNTLRQSANPRSHSRWTHRTVISGSSSSLVLREQVGFVTQREFGQNTSICHGHVCALSACWTDRVRGVPDQNGALRPVARRVTPWSPDAHEILWKSSISNHIVNDGIYRTELVPRFRHVNRELQFSLVNFPFKRHLPRG
jgi:hypothetical protein